MFLFLSFYDSMLDLKLLFIVVSVTIFAGCIMVILFLSEMYDFMTPKISEDLFVDTTRGSKLKINMDIVLGKIPCSSKWYLWN